MKKLLVTLTLSLLAVGATFAQDMPRKVKNVEILNLSGEPAMLPNWGKKNLIIFYVDPDRASQNQDFTDWLEESGRAKDDEIFGFGVINLKDAPFIPNKLARSMAEKRTEKSGALVLADQQRTISKEWGLGDCNNKFAAILVNKAGELVFLRKGILSESDKEEFLKVVDTWK